MYSPGICYLLNAKCKYNQKHGQIYSIENLRNGFLLRWIFTFCFISWMMFYENRIFFHPYKSLAVEKKASASWLKETNFNWKADISATLCQIIGLIRTDASARPCKGVEDYQFIPWQLTWKVDGHIWRNDYWWKRRCGLAVVLIMVMIMSHDQASILGIACRLL